MMEPILKFLEGEPIVSFALLLAVILIIPPLFERIKLPGLVGLLLAGVVLGPNGLRLLQEQSETMRLLSDIGLLYLMFVAGLEVDIKQFKRKKDRSAGFGILTFLFPLLTGILIGRIFGFGWNASILLGSILASHTLLAYPIISRLGVVSNEAVMVTIGATIFTDIGALLVLAICVGVHAGDFTPTKLLTLLISLAIYSCVILFGFDWAGREFFKRSGTEEGNQFLFVLLTVFLAALGAEMIGVEKIIGAFLAGLAVNDAVGEGPVKDKIVFVGTVLFIPIFFVDIGLLIDVKAFIKSTAAIGLMAAIVGGLVASKFVAAFLTRFLYRYSRTEMLVMWSLSIPQVGATLAATLVGFRVGLLSEDVLNSVIVMMLVTSTLGPLITSRTAPLLVNHLVVEAAEPTPVWSSDVMNPQFTVVVPVYNPQTEQYLIELAALIAKQEVGRIMPLAIALASGQMDDLPLTSALQRSDALLQRASELGQDLRVEVQPLLRIDHEIASAISRASREQNANLIVMGWSRRTGLRARLFGNVIDSVLWSAHCPVAVTRLLSSPQQIQQILVPIENLTQQAVRVMRFAQVIAEPNQATITLLHVCDRYTSAQQRAWTQSQLLLLAEQWMPHSQHEVLIMPHDQIVQAIVETARTYDLVILRSRRERSSAGGLSISDIATRVVQQLTCSVVMLGEPQRMNIPLLSDRTAQKNSSILP